MRIVVTGCSGRLGRRVAQKLATQHEVIGIDRRECPALPNNVILHQVDIRRRGAEDVFKHAPVDVVLHLGMVHNFRISSEQLYARNVIGTETLLRYASQYGVKKFVLLSSADAYGPSPTNSHYIHEDAPLMASQRFPEIRTLVAVDRAVQSFFWRYHDIETVILRPAHIVGPHIRNAPSNYLRLRIIPGLLGFDPMVQMIHEDDVVTALAESTIPGVRGVFNLAGTEPIPVNRVLKIVGKPVIRIPHMMFRAFLEKMWKYRLTSFPAPELDHIRFNTVLDTTRQKEMFKKIPEKNLYEILEPFRGGSSLSDD